MSEGFTIANFRTVAHGPQEGQFAVGERKKALGLSDLDPKYRRLLDEPVTMTLGLIGPGGRVALTPMWFDYEGEKVLVNTASHRPASIGSGLSFATNRYLPATSGSL